MPDHYPEDWPEVISPEAFGALELPTTVPVTYEGIVAGYAELTKSAKGIHAKIFCAPGLGETFRSGLSFHGISDTDVTESPYVAEGTAVVIYGGSGS